MTLTDIEVVIIRSLLGYTNRGLLKNSIDKQVDSDYDLIKMEDDLTTLYYKFLDEVDKRHINITDLTVSKKVSLL